MELFDKLFKRQNLPGRSLVTLESTVAIERDRRFSFTFDQLAEFVDMALLEAESQRVSTDKYGDTFKYSALGEKVVNQRTREEGFEEVTLVQDFDLVNDPKFAHLFARAEDESVIGDGARIVGILSLGGSELRSEMGKSMRTYTGDELMLIVKDAFDMCLRNWD